MYYDAETKKVRSCDHVLRRRDEKGAITRMSGRACGDQVSQKSGHSTRYLPRWLLHRFVEMGVWRGGGRYSSAIRIRGFRLLCASRFCEFFQVVGRRELCICKVFPILRVSYKVGYNGVCAARVRPFNYKRIKWIKCSSAIQPRGVEYIFRSSSSGDTSTSFKKAKNTRDTRGCSFGGTLNARGYTHTRVTRYTYKSI